MRPEEFEFAERCLQQLVKILELELHLACAGQPGSGALQRLHAPVADLVEEHVEGRLVELHDVDAGLDQFPRLLVLPYPRVQPAFRNLTL